MASFDHYANRYDEHFTHSHVGMLQRKQVYKQLLPLLDKNKNVLEINCGTGVDALALIQHVNSIEATDISTAMIERCERKNKNKIPGLDFKVTSIEELKNEFIQTNFILSNFGGLNCLSPNAFKDFSIKCSENAGQGLDLFLVLLPRKCIWERLYYFKKLNYVKAYRRNQKNGITTNIDNAEFNTWYYSPKDVKQFFGSAFKVKSYGPIGLFVPPSYLNPFFANKKKLLRLFEFLDCFFGNFKCLANYGDHFYIHLKKIH